MEYCKRCGKELKNPKSIKLGYGKTCNRIITLQSKIEEPTENTEIFDEVISTIRFLKCEIRMMKMQMKSMKLNGISDPIERIKQNEPRPEQDLNIGNMAQVHEEFKKLLSSVSDVRELLTKAPIETNLKSNEVSIYI